MGATGESQPEIPDTKPARGAATGETEHSGDAGAESPPSDERYEPL